MAPEYFCNTSTVESSAPDRALRSTNQNLPVDSTANMHGMRTFTMAAATFWNSLNVRDRGNKVRGSPSLESIQNNFKTLLFNEHFNHFPFDLNI